MQPMVPQSAAYGAPVAVVYDNGGIPALSRPSAGEGERVSSRTQTGRRRGYWHRLDRVGAQTPGTAMVMRLSLRCSALQ